MGRLRQRMMRTARRYWLSLGGLARPVGISFLLLFSGCAQLDQLMGRQAATVESAPPAQTAEPAAVAPAHENPPVQATDPASKPAAKKKAGESHSAGVAKESTQQTPAHVPAAGVGKQSEPELKKTEQDKALAEKEQPGKEKKSRVASDKKKKPAKSLAESQPPKEDVFLPPIPLPSKPAAIGGSGG